MELVGQRLATHLPGHVLITFNPWLSEKVSQRAGCCYSPVIDVDAVSGAGFGFVVGLVTGLVIDIWVWRLKKTSGEGVRWATTHMLALPPLWLGGGAGPGWAGSVLLQVLQLRPFLGWYFLTAVALTALCAAPVLVVFIHALGVESGTVTASAPVGREGPRGSGLEMTSWLQVGFIAIGGAPVGMLGLAAAAGGAPAIRTAWHALLVGCFVLALGLVVGIAAAGLSPVTSLAAFAAGVAVGVAGGGAAFVLGRFGQAGRRPVAHAVRQRVRAAMAPAPPRHLNRRLILAVVAAAVALAMATGAAFAAGLLTNRPISEVPVAIWQQHFQQEHHGTTGKGSLGPGEAGTLAAAQQRAGFQARTLKGIPGAKLNRVTSNTVTFRDGSREPTIELEYELGDVKVIATEIKDPHPDAPFEVPSLSPNMRIERIDDSQYLVIADETGKVRDMQFKTSDGIVFSVNFFGPPYPNAVGPGGVDVEFARNVIRHLS